MVSKDKQLIKKVERDYNAMAIAWDAKQTSLPAWRVKQIKRVQNGQTVLDLGCGNGILLYRYLAFKSISYIGVDISKKLLAIARKKARLANVLGMYRFVKSSLEKLHLADKTFDWIFCFAALHHLPKEMRLPAIREIWRVLKPGGKVAVTTWNLYSDFAVKKFGLVWSKSSGDSDVFIPWKATGGRVISRYLHAFTKEELSGLFKQAGFKKVSAYYASKQSGQRVADIMRGEDLVLTAER